jgi:ribokinase
MRVLLAGGIVVERQFFVESIPHKNEVALATTKFNLGLTSKVINAGRMMTAAHDVSILGSIGTDRDGEYALGELKKFRIKTKYITATTRDHTGQAIVQTDQSGDPAITVYQGANNYLQIPADLTPFDAYYLATSLPLPILYQLVEDKPKNVICFLDVPNKHQDINWNRLKQLDFFAPNRHEAELILNRSIETVDEAKQAVLELGEKIQGITILTLDSDGCLVQTNEGIKHISAPKVQVIDTTASGDIFRGVFFNQYLHNHDVLASATKAVEIASRSTESSGVYRSIQFAQELQ